MALLLKQLPPHMRVMVEAQLAKEDAEKPSEPETPAEKPKKLGRRRSQTEVLFERCWWEKWPIHYEAFVIRMPSGNRYTPDFVYWDDDGVIHFIEVKGSYKLGSHASALNRFREARAAFPQARFHWFVKTEAGFEEIYKSYCPDA
jgi:hypothetical protein